MTTIEGGMISQMIKKFMIIRIFRSHGMLREANNPKYEKKIRRSLIIYLHNLYFYIQRLILEIMKSGHV